MLGAAPEKRLGDLEQCVDERDEVVVEERDGAALLNNLRPVGAPARENEAVMWWMWGTEGE